MGQEDRAGTTETLTGYGDDRSAFAFENRCAPLNRTHLLSAKSVGGQVQPESLANFAGTRTTPIGEL